jgi:DNA-directed RNA polymerase I subunit RPA2
LQLLKEKLETWLLTLKSSILRKAKANAGTFDLTPTAMDWCLTKTMTLERLFENFMGTGNLPSQTGLGLMQDKGLTIMAENINRMRYMSHFRAIHR